MPIFDNAANVAKPRPMVVQLTVTFYKREKDGTIRTNDNTGARFWTAFTNDGNVRFVAKVDQAMDVIKNGHDISSLLAGRTVDLRLPMADFKALKSASKAMDEGVGVQFTAMLTKAPVLGQLTITNSSQGRNGDKRSAVLIGELLPDEPISPAAAVLTDSVKCDTLDELKAHFAEMANEELESLNQARATNQAARNSTNVDKDSEALV